MRVLIVDDDTTLLRLLEIAFASRGHQVESLGHALGVLGRLAGHATADGTDQLVPPDVCIIDNYLPEMSGMGLVNLAARTHLADRVPIVLFSSDPTVEDAVLDCKHPRVCFALKGKTIASFVELVERFAESSKA